MSTRNVPAGRWMQVQGRLRRGAHPASLISTHVGVGQRSRCCARDVESPAKLPTTSTRYVPAGRWMKVQGMFKRRAHLASLISVDVGVGQRCRAKDCKSPSVTLPTMNTRSVPAGRWMEAQGSSKYEHAHGEATTLQVARARSETPLGRWMRVEGQFKGERTVLARFSYTLVLVSVAVPSM
eukprot:scaffold45596_cov72-Phaeocystis_antarctica.AAC.1